MQTPNFPYPDDVSIENNIEHYKKSHQKGLKKATMVTYNLENKSYWETEIPVPVPAHFEFDPNNNRICYLSAHNFVFHKTKVIIEGQGELLRIKITEGNTSITHRYTNR